MARYSSAGISSTAPMVTAAATDRGCSCRRSSIAVSWPSWKIFRGSVRQAMAPKCSYRNRIPGAVVRVGGNSGIEVSLVVAIWAGRRWLQGFSCLVAPAAACDQFGCRPVVATVPV